MPTARPALSSLTTPLVTPPDVLNLLSTGGGEIIVLTRARISSTCGAAAAGSPTVVSIGIYGYTCSRYSLSITSEDSVEILPRDVPKIGFAGASDNSTYAIHWLPAATDGSWQLSLSRRRGTGTLSARIVACTATPSGGVLRMRSDVESCSPVPAFPGSESLDISSNAPTLIDLTARPAGAACAGSDGCWIYVTLSATDDEVYSITLDAGEFIDLIDGTPQAASVQGGRLEHFKFEQVAPFRDVHLTLTDLSGGDPDMYIAASSNSTLSVAQVAPVPGHRGTYSYHTVSVGSDSIVITASKYKEDVGSTDSGRVTFYITIHAYASSTFTLLAHAYGGACGTDGNYCPAAGEGSQEGYTCDTTGAACSFPFAFEHDGGRVTHDACVTDAPTPDGQSGLPWCATSVDPSTGDLLSTYGICRNSDISEAGPCTGHDGRRHPIVLSNGVAQNGYVMQGGWSYYSLEVATDAETLASGHGLTVRVTVDTPDLVEDVDMYV